MRPRYAFQIAVQDVFYSGPLFLRQTRAEGLMSMHFRIVERYEIFEPARHCRAGKTRNPWVTAGNDT